MKMLISVYSHPEFYPPTLNAIQILSQHVDNITIVSRHVLKSEWKYPDNCKLVTSGNFINIRESEKKPKLWKILSFIKYLFRLATTMIKEKPDWVLLYDPIPLFSFHLIVRIYPYPIKVWYHNHDIIQISREMKYSIQWVAAKTEKKNMRIIDIFSLPSKERLVRFYSQCDFIKNVYIVPNYPRKGYYLQFQAAKVQLEDELKLIFQGAAGKGFGFEEMIKLLGSQKRYFDFSVSLTIVGWIDPDYKNDLINLAISFNSLDYLTFIDPIPYSILPTITQKYHVGMAIYNSNNINNATGGTSSNKIYEYAALGLPVIVYDSVHYRSSLENYNWIAFTNLSETSLVQCISDIYKNYQHYSLSALTEFKEHLFFEKYLTPIIDNHFVENEK